MRPETRQKLLEINRLFYEHSAATFSATRRRLQPGVKRLLTTFPPQTDILDLGCGNGNLAGALARSGWVGTYLGIDASEALIADARAALAGVRPFFFFGGRLGRRKWLPCFRQSFPSSPFRGLHHIPDASAPGSFLSSARCCSRLRQAAAFCLAVLTTRACLASLCPGACGKLTQRT